ncbi:MAG: hypothetical protein CM1200mP34_5020 [Verrucomicrobiales bacterium]|nr:MAG: hypothetical protein CM1200mP34_5020 [Verrucomicrobiales bacterium]
MVPVASLPEPLVALVGELNRLPGIGPRSAERLALHLIQADTAVAKRLANVLVTSRDKIIECADWAAWPRNRRAAFCANPARDEQNPLRRRAGR